MIELERTFLAKSLPDLSNCKKLEIIDIYIPKEREHPNLRIRKIGDKFEMTKKSPLESDMSEQREFTVPLTEQEFNVLSKLDGKVMHKIRHHFIYNGRLAEIDVFQDKLKGLIIVDFEFENEEEKNNFQIPDFCLADITQEVIFAGGMIAGKSYEDIEEVLKKFGYKKL